MSIIGVCFTACDVYAHKSVLSTRNEVMAMMFNGKFAEKKTDENMTVVSTVPVSNIFFEVMLPKCIL